MFEGVFGFLLGYPPVLAVTIFSVFILIFINIFYKILIKQEDAKALKDRSKAIGKEMKEAQKAGKTEESKKLMSEMMENNSKLMRMSMKPMFISLIIVILLLPTMSTFYGDKFAPVNDGVISLNGADYSFSVDDSTIDINGNNCENSCVVDLAGTNYKVSLNGASVKFAQIVAELPITLPFLGNSFGWLGWYIINSIPIAIVIRKFLKIQT